ncbi:MAG TPA: TIM barrel protein [Candidatus Eremiobacteraceae bacterium]|nr:TIM barrel protein [Candidatus Eremiobacteraceae bacterium]
MKLCCSTAAFGRALDNGALTQLEWIDVCASELDVDGVEFDGAYFPRTDGDYLAQLKKLCADRCLTVAGVRSPVALGGADIDASVAGFLPWIGHAAELGSPLLRFSVAGVPDGSPGIAWRELIRGLKAACVDAKRANITLALERGDEGSLVASPADMKRAQKECDSAWLRIATRAEDLAGDKSTDFRALLDETVLVTARSDDRRSIDVIRSSGYRGFIALVGEQLAVGRFEALIAAWRRQPDGKAAVP